MSGCANRCGRSFLLLGHPQNWAEIDESKNLLSFSHVFFSLMKVKGGALIKTQNIGATLGYDISPFGFS
jgi:hypothetical protein